MEKRDLLWIGVYVILLVSDVWSLDPGSYQTTPVNHSPEAETGPSSPPRSQQIKNVVVQTVNVNQGTEVNLNCGEKNWNETLYVIWKITLKGRSCGISLEQDTPLKDNCTDGKHLVTLPGSPSYLRIPDFSLEDVGIYSCESPYDGGTSKEAFNVTVTVPPKSSAWLEHRSNKMVAFCQAEEGKPAANISWSRQTGTASVKYQTSDGLTSVFSHLELAKDADTENLTCIINHPFWDEDMVLVPQIKTGNLFWPLITMGVVLGAVLVLVSAFFIHRKMMLTRRGDVSDTSLSKFSSSEYAEEVEPYASYIQRVNSIYN